MGFGPDISIGQATASAVASDLPPMVLGAAGLLGRPFVRPAPEPDALDWDEHGVLIQPEPKKVVGLPSPCLRLLTVPFRDDGGHQCDAYCPGRQRDGGCLCDVVRDAQERGAEWSFEVDSEGYWNYVGG